MIGSRRVITGAQARQVGGQWLGVLRPDPPGVGKVICPGLQAGALGTGSRHISASKGRRGHHLLSAPEFLLLPATTLDLLPQASCL